MTAKLAAKITIGLIAIAVGCTGPGGSSSGQDDGQYRMVAVQGGIDGPATKGDWDSAKAEPNVSCGLEDIVHDDLDDHLDDEVPDRRWGHLRPDTPGRCGDDYETLMYRLTNCEREARGLPPLECDLRLVWTGREHSRDMQKREYFDHRTPEGVDAGQRLLAHDVQWLGAAENIAMSPTMALAHTGWMESGGHRRNVLDGQFTHLGIGVIKTDRGYLLTALFITPEH